MNHVVKFLEIRFAYFFKLNMSVAHTHTVDFHVLKQMKCWICWLVYELWVQVLLAKYGHPREYVEGKNLS